MSNWEGLADRECGEHRTTGGRAWCFSDSEWCSERVPCRGCELPALRAERDEAIRLLRSVHRVLYTPEVEAFLTKHEEPFDEKEPEE